MWVRFVLLIAVLLNEEDEVSGRYDFEEIEKLNKNDLEGIDMFNVKTNYIIMFIFNLLEFHNVRTSPHFLLKIMNMLKNQALMTLF